MNRVLFVGILMCAFFILLASVGPLIAPYPVDYDEKILSVKGENGNEVLASPHPPGRRHIFGTDPWGYDLLTLMLHGARYTVFLSIGIALTRILLGFLIALFLPWNRIDGKINSKPSVFGSIPLFLIIYFLLYNIFLNPPISKLAYTMLQFSLMCAVGVPSVYPAIREKMRQTAELPFVTAAKSMGAGKIRITLKHIIPQLYGQMLLLFSQETISVLYLFGTLGVFNMFIGGTRYSTHPDLFHSMSHEWAGLLGQYRVYLLKQTELWLIFFPLTGYILLLLSYYIFSRGLALKLSGKR